MNFILIASQLNFVIYSWIETIIARAGLSLI